MKKIKLVFLLLMFFLSSFSQNQSKYLFVNSFSDLPYRFVKTIRYNTVLYEDNNISSNNLLTITHWNTVLESEEQNMGWHKVIYNGVEGWLFGMDVYEVNNEGVRLIYDNSKRHKKIYKTDIKPQLSDKIPPKITITEPNITRGFKPVSSNNEIIIKGVVTDASGVYKVLINGAEVNIQTNGMFTHTALLAVGENSFTLTATDTKRNIATEQFTIKRNPNQQETNVVDNQTNNIVLKTGKYYALIIGNNKYQDQAITSLDEPINDATKIYNVLTTKYTFEKQNVIFIKNATYVEMIEAFDDLRNKITEEDNLLVFYAGHGYWNDETNLGYWLPVDAKKNSTAHWIANSRISDYMSSIKSKHTLLIADACFSGSIFKTRSAFADAQPAINKLYELPSKKAMTSGNLKEVPDKSVFLQYLVKRLNNNTDKYISADMLFASFRIAIMNNSNTEPQFGTIQNAGDEGGEFIFIRKN